MSATRTAAARPPSTAHVLQRGQLDATDRMRVAAVGFAVHHLGDFLDHADVLVAHRATATLTQQIEAVLRDDGTIDDIADLVADPGRTALPGGADARTLLGDRWSEIEPALAERAELARRGAADFGQDAIVNLALVRGLAERQPWWGTLAWEQRVDEWAEYSPLNERVAQRLRDQPDRVSDDIVFDVLGSAARAARAAAKVA